jgi:hypothetical protein
MEVLTPICVVQTVAPYITEVGMNELLDGFYARLLINTKGLYEYVKSHDASGSHAPTAEPTNTLHGMNKYSIYQLIEHIRSQSSDHVFTQLRDCYAQTGFLVFTDDWKNVVVYSENDETWKKWLETAQNDGPASWEVYNEFQSFA